MQIIFFTSSYIFVILYQKNMSKATFLGFEFSQFIYKLGLLSFLYEQLYENAPNVRDINPFDVKLSYQTKTLLQ